MSAAQGPLFGRITLVYPQIQDGRVIADAAVPGLGSYFVGQRIPVWISAGERMSYVIPGKLRPDALRPQLRQPPPPRRRQRGGAGAARPRPADAGDARRRGDPFRTAERRRAGRSHESRHFRTADQSDAALAADAAVPAGGAGGRAGRAADHPARGGPADQGADGGHPGVRQRAARARRGGAGDQAAGDAASPPSPASSTCTARARTTA